MAENKKSFIAYADWKEIFDELPDQDAGGLIKHIFAYVNDENPTTDSVLIKAVFANIKSTLKRDLKKWEGQKKQRSEAGKASAASRSTKSNERSTYGNETVRNSTVSVSVNVSDSEKEKIDTPPSAEFDFKKALALYGFDQKLIKDWVKVRKTKRGTNTETAYEAFVSEVEKTGKDKNKVLKLCVIKSWAGFKAEWYEDPDQILTEKCPYTPEQLRIFRANLNGQGSPGKDFDMKWIKEIQ